MPVQYDVNYPLKAAATLCASAEQETTTQPSTNMRMLLACHQQLPTWDTPAGLHAGWYNTVFVSCVCYLHKCQLGHSYTNHAVSS